MKCFVEVVNVFEIFCDRIDVEERLGRLSALYILRINGYLILQTSYNILNLVRLSVVIEVVHSLRAILQGVLALALSPWSHLLPRPH